MIRFRKLLCVLLAAAVLPGMLAGCRKSDGTEVFPTETVPVPENPKADEQDKSFTSIAVSEFAKTDAPFPLDDAQRPQQGIVMVMIFDDTEMKLNHTQAVNYFDSDGNVYRYRHAVDPDGDWLSVLTEHYRQGAQPVSLLGETEKKALWHLCQNAEKYRGAEQKTQKASGDVLGIKWLYLLDGSDDPILLARYDDLSVYIGDSEVTAFLNWFRLFQHNKITFGG